MTLVEPRIYATHFMGASLKMSPMNAAYDPVRAALMAKYADGVPGDPVKVAEAVLDLVADDAPPRRLLLGDGDFDVIVDLHHERVAEWRSREAVSRAAG